MLRIAEVYLNVSSQRETLMVSHLFSPIPGQRLVEFPWQLVCLIDQGINHRLGIFASHPNQHHVASMAFDQSGDLAIVAAEQ